MTVNFDPRPCISVSEGSDLFKKVSQTKNETIYSLRVEKLSEDNCYIFYCYNNFRNKLVLAMLEFYTFHPLSKLSEKFQIEHFTYDKSMVCMAYFPRQFADVCVRAAKVFDMTIATGKVTMSETSALTFADDYKRRSKFDEVERLKPVKTTYVFPKADNILWVLGKDITRKELDLHERDIHFWGNYFQKMGVD
jgi:hypothetical protein